MWRHTGWVGRAGNVVLVGHLDTVEGGLGVFAGLLTMTEAQHVTVTDTSGHRHAYRVSSRQQVARTSLPSTLFISTGPPRLVLITCGGSYDRQQHRYDDNIVVIATPS